MMLSLVRKVCIESDNDAIFVLVSCLHIINKVTAEGLNLNFLWKNLFTDKIFLIDQRTERIKSNQLQLAN